MVTNSFLIAPIGNTCSNKVISSIHTLLIDAALSVVKPMNDWIPAVHEGKNVWSNYIIPIKFRLNQSLAIEW